MVTFIIIFIQALIEGIMVLLSVSQMISIKKTVFMKTVLLFGCFLISGMVIFIGDLDNLPGTIILFMAAVCIGTKGTFIKRFTIGLMFASTIFASNALIDNFIGYNEQIFRIIFVICLYFGVKHFAPDKDYELNKSMWQLLLLLTLTPIGIVFSVILLGDGNSGFDSSSSMYFVLLLIALFSFIGLLWIVTVLAKQRKLEQQGMFAEINRKYYEAMEQQHFEIRRLKHDLSNHLQVLSTLPEKEKTEYIEELLEKETVTATLNYCSDATVNAVLTIKDNIIKENNIKFKKKIDIKSELPIEKAEICALFANALDNAIESCINVSDKEKVIILEARAISGMFAMSIKNSANINVEGEKLPETSKRDKNNHGLGLRSIKEIVDRYDGNMKISSEEGFFELFLYIPLKEK